MEKQYCTIRTNADIEIFQDISNGLHDGYITHVDYHNNGISAHDHGLSFDYTGLSLMIRVLVTSLPGCPTFELTFRSVYEWQIRSCQFSDMAGCTIRILENGTFLWADDVSRDIDDLVHGSYVIAQSIQYRQLS